MKKLYRYRIHSTLFQSEFPIPALAGALVPGGSSLKNVRFREKRFRVEPPRGEWFRVRGLFYRAGSPRRRVAVLRSPFVGDFKVNFSERTIDWNPSRQDSRQLASVIASGRALSLLLPHLKPCLVLHAVGLQIRRKAVLFVAPSGGGKSTLAASFLNEGHPLICEDIAVIRREGSRFLLEPGAPQIRLWPRAARRLSKLRQGSRVCPETVKEFFPLNRQGSWRFRGSAAPVAAVYFLSRGSRPEIRIEPLKPKEALFHCMDHRHTPLPQGPRIDGRQFAVASELVQNVRVRRLVYPSGFGRLAAVRQAVLADLNA